MFLNFFISADILTGLVIASSIFNILPKKTILLASATLLSVMICSYLFAANCIPLFGFSAQSVQMCAGLLLFLKGFFGIFKKQNDNSWAVSISKNASKSMLIFPLSTPVIIGPSWFSMAMFASTKASLTENIFNIFYAWGILSAFIVLLFIFAKKHISYAAIISLQTVLSLIATLVGAQLFIDSVLSIIR